MMYKLIKTYVQTETAVSIPTYGVQCGTQIVKDISTDKNLVLKFIKKINKYKLSTLHLYDVLEDTWG